MIAAQASATRPSTSFWQPRPWKGFSMGIALGALCAGAALLRLSAASSSPALERPPAGLTAVEERKVQAALADGRQTWQSALAYFASMEEAGNGAADHRDEIDTVVAGSIHTRLVEQLGAERAARAERDLGSLVAAVAEMPPRR
jgi:hypothetical protein